MIAVDSFSLEIKQGEFITLLGPSGCGKTTLLRLIGGFEKPDHGTIYLDGENILSLPPEKRQVNTVFQSYALFPHMSVYENIAFGLRLKNIGISELEETVEAALEQTQMTPVCRQAALAAFRWAAAEGGNGKSHRQQASRAAS